MKKMNHLFLVAFYLLANIGFSANLHYCGNSLAGISIANIIGSNSCACDDENNPQEGCCSEEQISYQCITEHPQVSSKVTMDKIGELQVRVTATTLKIVPKEYLSLIDKKELFQKQKVPDPVRYLFCVYLI